MRKSWSDEVEAHRIISGPMSSPYGEPSGGAFSFIRDAACLRVVASNGHEWEEAGLPPPAWEHVSVSLKHRCPTWEEMAWIASLFWEPDEVLVQYRPAAAEYRNHHPYCLHWWKPVGISIPTPPPETVAT